MTARGRMNPNMVVRVNFYFKDKLVFMTLTIEDDIELFY